MRVLLVIAVAAMLSGCASAKLNYTTPSKAPEVSNEVTIDEGFDTFWDKYIGELSASFFVINNVSKESRIINVSFSSNDPEKYVTCGKSQVTSKHPSLGERTFSYDPAESSRLWLGVDGTNGYIERVRTTSLDGRANIYISPQSNQKTNVRVNIGYSLTIKVRDEGYTTGPYRNSDVYTVGFSTQEPSGPMGGISSSGWMGELSCASKGTIEADLTNLARD